jgi:hypothetical protein
MSKDERPSEIGYRQPPKHTQFRKGMSGNPKGRPKGSRNLASIFRKISEEKVQVNGPKGPRFITKLEAGITQLVNRAAKGDLKAVREMMRCRQAFGDQAPVMAPPIINVRFVKAKDGKPLESAEGPKDQD